MEIRASGQTLKKNQKKKKSKKAGSWQYYFNVQMGTNPFGVFEEFLSKKLIRIIEIRNFLFTFWIKK